MIDTHVHLSDPKFDLDRDLAIKRAKENGITKIIEVGCEPFLWKPSFRLSELNPEIYCAFGIHPHEAKTATTELFNTLENLLRQPKAVAIGETGLDYYYNHSPKDIQKQVLKTHLELSLKIKKPVIIHCRDAYQDLLDILNEYTGLSGVIHCFSGNTEEAKKLIELGFFLGIDGPVTYPKALVLKEVVKEIPLEKLLIETDSPYLPPQTYRGKRNEPSYLPHIADEIAKIKKIEINKVCEITLNSSIELFKF
jgi:TatD DNase family protein